MRLGLPNPDGEPGSIRAETLEILAEIRKYRAAELAGDIEKIIHDVAMNSDISGRVIAKIKSELPACRGRYFRISVRLTLIWLSLIPLLFIVHRFLKTYVAPHTVTDGLWAAIIVTVVLYIASYFDWRKEYRDSYIADFLIRSLEFGLRYQSSLTDERLRDGFATMIQRRLFKSPQLIAAPASCAIVIK